MHTPTYAPGTVVRARSRPWRDAQEGDVLVATPIEGGDTEQQKFYIPLEDIRPGRLEPPSLRSWATPLLRTSSCVPTASACSTVQPP